MNTYYLESGTLQGAAAFCPFSEGFVEVLLGQLNKMQRERLHYSSRYYCFYLKIPKLSIHSNCPLRIHSRKILTAF